MSRLRAHPAAAREAAPAPADAADAGRGGARLAIEPPVHDARRLTGGGREARIMLDGVAYTLRVTRQGKLILTK